MRNSDPNLAPTTRRTLVSIAGVILLVFVINGIVAVFGLHYAAEQHMKNLDEFDRLFVTLDTVHAAEIGFKRQVQEWKNVLLRGSEPQDLVHYHNAFEAEQSQVKAKLEALLGQGERVDQVRIASLLEEHKRLAVRYAEAYAGFDPASPTGAARVDHLVRGMDRPFAESLDALVAEVSRRVDAMRAASRAADAERYQTLRLLNLAASGIGAGLVLILLLAALRGQR